MTNTSRQTWLIRSCIVSPMVAATAYHVLRLYQNLPTISLLLFLVAVGIALLTLWTVERKYEYKLPSKSDIFSCGLAFLLLGGFNFWLDYNVHNHDKVHEALSSLLSLLCLFPFMLFVGQKKSIPIKSARTL